MNRVKIITIIFLSLLILQISGCTNTGLEPLRKELEELGFTLYEPPRSNRGPGWTFNIVSTFDGRRVPKTICENLYPQLELKPGNLTLAKLQTNSVLDLNLGIEFLKDLLINPIEAKAKLKKVKEVSIKWKDVKSVEIPDNLKFDKKGKPIAIQADCLSDIRDLKAKKAFKNSVFMVQEVLLAHELDYEFKTDNQSEAGLKGKYKQFLDFQLGVKTEEKSETSLVVKEKRYLGFIAFLIEDVVPDGLLGAENALVSGRVVTLEQMKQIFGGS